MGRVCQFLAAFGLDILIVCAAVASGVGTVLRTDADRPDGSKLWFEAAALSIVLLGLCARRQFPFLAAAAVWVVAPALSFLDGNLIVTQAGVFMCGMGAAILLGSLRSGLQSRAGLLLVLLGSPTVVYNDPTHGPGDFFFTPVLFAIGWLVGYALRERNQQAEAAEDRALRAERRPGGGGRRTRPHGARAP